jgi:hypothetical protein
MTTLRVAPTRGLAQQQSGRRLTKVTPATSATWRAAVDTDPFALPEQSSEWIKAICSVGNGRDMSRAYTFSDDSTFVVPLVRTGPGELGNVWSPPPAWGIGGIVGPDIDSTAVSAIVDDLRAIRAARVSVRIDARHDHLWTGTLRPGDITIARRSHIASLDHDPETHLKGLSSSTRYNIRRAQRDGVRIQTDTTGALLDTHYELFLISVLRWAEKQNEPSALALLRAKRRDPLHKLRAMQQALGDRFLSVVAYVNDTPAASAIVLLGPTARYTRGAMDVVVAGKTHANFAVQWEAITAAYEFGSTRYHMGESGGSSGIGAFKEKFGASPFDHNEYRFERLPITRTTDFARRAVKRVIGFRDT